jgi:Holliday junction resolvase RusA-like endonuclease
MIYKLEINPVSKPRMTQSDKWKKRTATDKYWAYKDALILMANKQGLHGLPTEIAGIHFYIEMPKTWSKKKRSEMVSQFHTEKPDLDNLLKGLQDALCTKDEHIASIQGLYKFWAEKGEILIILSTISK